LTTSETFRNKSSSGDEIPERDVTYIVLYDQCTTHLYFRSGIVFISKAHVLRTRNRYALKECPACRCVVLFI